MNAFWVMYLLTRLFIVYEFFTVCGLIAILAIVIVGLISLILKAASIIEYDDEALKQYMVTLKPLFKQILIYSIIVLLIYAGLPSKTDMLIIITGGILLDNREDIVIKGKQLAVLFGFSVDMLAKMVNEQIQNE